MSVSLVSVLLVILIWTAIAHNKGNSSQSNPQQPTSSRLAPTSSGPFKYLPEGATIADQSRDVVFADIDGDGQKEQIIFYSLVKSRSDRKAGVLVLKRSGGDYVRVWEKVYDDSGGFGPPTGVYDPGRSDKLQIFSYRTIGASCPGVLDIFENRGGKIEQVSTPWSQKGGCQVAEVNDLNGNGTNQLVIKSKDSGVLTTDIYVWNGQNYVERDTDYSQFYTSELGQLFQDIHAKRALPVSARVALSRQAARIYVLQRRYTEAIQLLDAVLPMIDDPNFTQPNSTIAEDASSKQKEKMSAWFEVEKNEAKSAIHRLLSDTLKSAGDVQRARKELMEAQTLQSLASDEKAKMQP